MAQMIIIEGLIISFFHARIQIGDSREITGKPKKWRDGLIARFEDANGTWQSFKPEIEFKKIASLFGGVKEYTKYCAQLFESEFAPHNVKQTEYINIQTMKAIVEYIEGFYGCNRNAVILKNKQRTCGEYGPHEIHPDAEIDLQATTSYQAIRNFRNARTHPWGGTWRYDN